MKDKGKEGRGKGEEEIKIEGKEKKKEMGSGRNRTCDRSNEVELNERGKKIEEENTKSDSPWNQTRFTDTTKG